MAIYKLFDKTDKYVTKTPLNKERPLSTKSTRISTTQRKIVEDIDHSQQKKYPNLYHTLDIKREVNEKYRQKPLTNSLEKLLKKHKGAGL